MGNFCTECVHCVFEKSAKYGWAELGCLICDPEDKDGGVRKDKCTHQNVKIRGEKYIRKCDYARSLIHSNGKCLVDEVKECPKFFQGKAKWVRESTWWKPWTWLSGHWED